MKTRTTRLICLFLSLVMLVGMLPAAYATETTETTQSTETTAAVEPTGETTAPTEETTAPTEATTAPTEVTTAPTEETTAPTEETTAPTEETTAPTEETAAPTEETTVPTVDMNAVENDITVYSDVSTYSVAHTQQEAVAWMYSMVGQSLDMDGAFEEQCVDLILAYYDYLGVPRSSGSGKDYATNALPAGWQRIQGAVPQPGDILVYGASADNEHGHVALFESERSHFHQNFGGNPYVERITYRYNGLSNPYWGVIRPDFSSAPTQINMSWGNDSVESWETNAYLATRATAGFQGNFTQAGIYLWQGEQLLASHTENISTYNNYLNIWYNLNEELRWYLNPGTPYTYQFFVTFNGETYNGPKLEFTTTGTTHITGIHLSKTSATMEIGDTLELEANVQPDYANDKSVSWTTSNAAVATVSNGTVKAVGVGTSNITATTYDGKTAQCVVTVTEKATVKTVPMYRLYNPFSLEHLFTTGEGEKESLAAIGWIYEGVAWEAPTTGTPIYRLYNPYSDGHFYTASEAEVQSLLPLGWRMDGVVTYSAGSSGTPIYRLFNPYETKNYHHYTTSWEEINMLTALGWILEGIAWYAA